MNGDPWRAARRDACAIGQDIRRRRTLAGLTQAQLGELIGLDAPQMSRIERGETIPFAHQAVVLAVWMDGQTRLQTPYSDDPPVSAVSMPYNPHTAIRSEDGDTSYRAACAVNRANATKLHWWVIDRLAEHPEGATHEQLWMIHTRTQAEPRTSQSGLRTRVSELVRGGVVEDSGKRRTMTTGRQAIVWQLTNTERHP